MKAAIIYLTQVRRLQKLMRSLNLLQQHFLAYHPYPVLLCHEGDFLEPQQLLLQGICPGLQFREVRLATPKHIDISQAKSWAMQRFGLGYRNMCRFFSMGLYPKIANLDYYMRLDDDSFIQSRVAEDPFKMMEKEGKVYAWRCKRPEQHKAIEGLQKCLSDHDAHFKDIKWDRHIFYNNFHIAKPSLWTSEPCKGALDAIDQHGGIYTKRWGDAPIQTLLVRAYVPPEQRHCFTGFKYSHGRHTWPAGR